MNLSELSPKLPLPYEDCARALDGRHDKDLISTIANRLESGWRDFYMMLKIAEDKPSFDASCDVCIEGRKNWIYILNLGQAHRPYLNEGVLYELINGATLAFEIISDTIPNEKHESLRLDQQIEIIEEMKKSTQARIQSLQQLRDGASIHDFVNVAINTEKVLIEN